MDSELTSQSKKAAVIGAGIGGLAVAIRLQVKGYAVSVYEAADRPGGKLNELRLGDFRFDAGPSLFTMPHLIDELFELAGKKAVDYFQYEPLEMITRYMYPDKTVIHAWQDVNQLIEELSQKTGEPARHIHRFLKKSEDLYDLTAHVFLERSLHRLNTYLQKDTIRSILQLYKLDAFRTMHRANQSFFNSDKLTQLFDRYATYNGSDPYQAPATLNIIPHLEHHIGAFFPKGGMYQICQSLFLLAKELGVVFHFNTRAKRILLNGKTVSGLETSMGKVDAERVISNADIVPTYRQLLPQIPEPRLRLNQPRSSSALIFYWAMDQSFPDLDLHNIFFSGDYRAEFEAMWKQQTIFEDPTVYLYISAKSNPADAPTGCENWFVMINVPANQGQDWEVLTQKARQGIIHKLSDLLETDIQTHIQAEAILDPVKIESRTSSFQGALYGNSSNNRLAAFLRHPNFHRRIKGLYFCGGSVHPGGGIPLCLLSAKIVDDLVA